MRPSLTEDQAWSVILATPVGRDPVRIPHPDAPEEGVEVAGDGGWETRAFVTDRARCVLDLYLPLRRRREWVVGQMGQSLDGRIATESGHSHYMTGPEDIRRLHRMRALADAVVVGAGTAASDDPRLTVREVEGEDPVRVVLDPDARLDPELRIFTDGRARTLVVRAEGVEAEAPGRAEVLCLPADGAREMAPPAILEALRARGLVRVLVEGGGITVSRFLAAGALDRIHVTVAPLILGSGRPAFTLEPVETLREALRPTCRTFPLGDDILFELDLRVPPPAPGAQEDAE